MTAPPYYFLWGEIMSKIKTNFEMGWDKVWHFLGCFLITVVLILVTGNNYMSFGAVVLGGFLKEVHDYQHRDRHCPDLYDFLADTLGALLAVLLMSLYN